MASLSAFAKCAIGTVPIRQTAFRRIQNFLCGSFVKAQLPQFDFVSVDIRVTVAFFKRWLGGIILDVFGGSRFRFGSFFLGGCLLLDTELLSAFFAPVNLQRFLAQQSLRLLGQG